MKTITRTVHLASLTLSLAAWLLYPQSAQCFYNPSTGRWLSRDPIAEAGAKNIYRFARNCPISFSDALGHRDRPGDHCYCCECAEDISIPFYRTMPSPSTGQPGHFFGVDILLSYRIVMLPFAPSAPSYKWEEKSNRPPNWLVEKGAKPNEWYNAFELDPSLVNDNWSKRDRSCAVPSRLVLDGDTPAYDPSKGKRYMEFRISIVNPPECKCPLPAVTVTALQILDPAASPSPGTFQTPDPTPN